MRHYLHHRIRLKNVKRLMRHYLNADLTINTGNLPLDECVEQVLVLLKARGVIG
jgi:hypothetical protein